MTNTGLVDPTLVSALLSQSPADAWSLLAARCLQICSAPLPSQAPLQEVARREDVVAELDRLVATAAWSLYPALPSSYPRTAARLEQLWAEQPGGLAMLVLDGLSLRELPWLLKGAEQRGLRASFSATASELPSDTTRFARALGLSQRADLANDHGRHIAAFAKRFPGATTDTTGMSWTDLARTLPPEPRLFVWHHFPDERLHEYSGPGTGLHDLLLEVDKHLGGEEFWALVTRLCTGRTLVIASDHGYAACHRFPDASEQASAVLREALGASRSRPGASSAEGWVPPLALTLDGGHGVFSMALGRRKWKVQGGHPTLAHGGLSLLEVLTPLVVMEGKS